MTHQPTNPLRAASIVGVCLLVSVVGGALFGVLALMSDETAQTKTRARIDNLNQSIAHYGGSGYTRTFDPQGREILIKKEDVREDDRTRRAGAVDRYQWQQRWHNTFKASAIGGCVFSLLFFAVLCFLLRRWSP